MTPAAARHHLVRVEIDGAIATVTLDRPEALNAMNDELREQLLDVLTELRRDGAIGAVVLTGEGRAFCAGGDLKAMGERLEAPAGEVAFAGWRRMHEVSRLITTLHGLDKVTIAAVNGPAAGLGCDLALCCDLVVASTAATFSFSYLRRGLVPDGGGMYFLPRRVGLARAKELFFSARDVAAAEALAIGLVERVVEPDELLAEVQSLGEELTKVPFSALALTKSILDRSLESSLEEIFELGAGAQAISYTTDAHREAVEAFLSSRRRG